MVKLGYWGQVTSSVDWCETNYEYTEYIAEYFNTISSVAMVIVGVLGVAFHCKNHEKRFAMANLEIMAVGFGSMAFHMTLKQPM
jgi:dihydroceramidase